jgi:hypothetical protein
MFYSETSEDLLNVLVTLIYNILILKISTRMENKNLS